MALPALRSVMTITFHRNTSIYHRGNIDMAKKLKAGILGYGRMGSGFVAAMQESELWEVAAVYDICGRARQLARQHLPNAAIYDAPEPIFADPSIDAVGLFTLADARP